MIPESLHITVVSRNTEIIRLITEKAENFDGAELRVSAFDPQKNFDGDIACDVVVVDTDEEKIFNEEMGKLSKEQ